MTETFYEVLGVDADASQDEITDAYRERVKETHPDLNDSENASEQFQRVAEAEEVLGDPDERARYDRLGHASYQRTFDGTGGRRRNSGTSADDGRDNRSRTDGRTSDVGGEGTESGRDEYDWADDPFGNRNRRQEYPGSDRKATDDGNRSRRSYYVGDDAGNRSTSRTGTSSASAAADGAATADGGATAGGKTAAASTDHARRKTRGKGEHVAADDADEWTGFSVHDWDDEELEPDPVRVSLSHHSLVAVGLTFVMYPLLAFMTVAPMVNLFVNVAVGACTLLLLGYLFTIPRVSMVGFGTMTVLVTLVLAFVGVNLLAPLSLFLIGACLVPFGYSVLFTRVVG